MKLKPGTRLKSVTCNAEGMVIKAAAEGCLSCGGSEMVDIDADNIAKVDMNEDFAHGSLLGKRYINAEGSFEVLCTKPGDGSFALDGNLLLEKETKKLPSSD